MFRGTLTQAVSIVAIITAATAMGNNHINNNNCNSTDTSMQQQIDNHNNNMDQLLDMSGGMSSSSSSISNNNNNNKGGLRWLNLTVTRRQQRGQDDDDVDTTIILHTNSGFVENGHVCGVIGPSGAGKSTFLHALSGSGNKNLVQSGHVWIDEMIHNKVVMSSYLSSGAGEVAMLQQDDAFFTMLTPNEILDLAAKLQLPSSITKEVREEIIKSLINSLGLKGVHHRRVGERLTGNSSSGGLSGGEKRRLSVAVELITHPKVILADEATTGLDSNQAEKVLTLISKVAKDKNVPCICTLHQPRASIWKKLDSFMLLAPGGRLCYMGDRKSATIYFASIGYKCPPETNPAEYFIDLVSIDTEDPEEAEIDRLRVDYIVSEFERKRGVNAVSSSTSNHNEIHWRPPHPQLLSRRKVTLERRINGFQRFASLVLRAWRQNIRDLRLNVLRIFISVGQSFLFAQIFPTVTKIATVKSIADRVSMLSYGVITMSMMTLMTSLDLFAREKPVVTRERRRKQYTGAEYLMSKVIAEIPMNTIFATTFAYSLKALTGVQCSGEVLSATYVLLTMSSSTLGYAIGSFAPNADSAKIMGVPIMVVYMILGVINPSGVDPDAPEPNLFLRSVKNLSPFKWAIEGLLVSECRDLEFGKQNKKNTSFLKKIVQGPKLGALVSVQNGNQVLDALGISKSTWRNSMRSLGKLTVLHIAITVVGLWACGPSSTGNGRSTVNKNVDSTLFQSVPESNPDVRGESSETTMSSSQRKFWNAKPKIL